ncbi:MAG: cobyric acid synthase [Lachnospiraceae bacterium]|nr:cobyric acid synthase [Lachnospiraceae bacterium]
MAKVIMVQGTMSGAGKSFIVAGLLRIFKQDGYRVAPFKSQNMALNSYITEEGLEMGRAQVMQAEAAGIRPEVCMNPILLKPTDNVGSQVIVNGEVVGNMSATEYFSYKKSLVPEIEKAFRKLSDEVDIIVIEGAGSPAEINLKENDIVNMGMAEIANSNVLLVGDIDRGGVFAQLLGTMMLLEEDEKKRVTGLIINKFRGDKSLLDSGIEMLEEKSGVKVCGVLPYMDVRIEDEDSLSERLSNSKFSDGKMIDIVIIRFPKISNFTDFNVFEEDPRVSVRYVTDERELGKPDLIILPGSKNTISDLKWLRSSGLENAILQLNVSEDVPIFGICGGFQMLGTRIEDPDCVESGGEIQGLGLLPVSTVLKKEKTRAQKEGVINPVGGIFESLSGCSFEGYEIHMGETAVMGSGTVTSAVMGSGTFAGAGTGNVYGTYVHGIFDRKETASAILEALAKRKGLSGFEASLLNYREYKEREYDRMADVLRQYLDMEAIYGMLK